MSKEVIKVFNCPVCLHVTTHVGSRLPNYCVECGMPILEKLRLTPDAFHAVGNLTITPEPESDGKK